MTFEYSKIRKLNAVPHKISLSKTKRKIRSYGDFDDFIRASKVQKQTQTAVPVSDLKGQKDAKF